MAKSKSKSTSLAIGGPDDNWMAKNDARTLMDAEIINKDKQRLAKARAAAKEIVKESKKSMDAAISIVKK